MPTSARLLIPTPLLSTTPVDIPADLLAMVTALEARGVGYTHGIASARPAAGENGYFYWATDTGVLSYDDGTTWHNVNVNNPFGTTVTDLNAFFPGAIPDGTRGLLTVASGAAHVPVIYSAILSKWVTAEIWEVFLGTFTVTGLETDIPGVSFNGLFEFYKGMYDAGLRPQYAMAGGLFTPGGGGSQARLNVQIREFNDGDASASNNVVANTNGGIGTTSGTTILKFSGWVTPTQITAPTKTHALIIARLSADGGGGNQATLGAGSIKLRMVG